MTLASPSESTPEPYTPTTPADDRLSEPEVRVGQVWRRKKDGTRVRIVSGNSYWQDWAWREVDGTRKGRIFDYNLLRLYDLIGDTP